MPARYVVPGRDYPRGCYAPRGGGFYGGFDFVRRPLIGGLFGGRRSRRAGFAPPYMHGNRSGVANQDERKAQFYDRRAQWSRTGIDPWAATYGGMATAPGYYYDEGMLDAGLGYLPHGYGRRRRSKIGRSGGRGYSGIGGVYPDFYDGAFAASGEPHLTYEPFYRYGPPPPGLRGDYDPYDDLDDLDFDDDDVVFDPYEDELDDVSDIYLPYGQSHGLLGGRRRYGGRRLGHY